MGHAFADKPCGAGFLTSWSLRTTLSFVLENTAAAGGLVCGWEELLGGQITLCVLQTHKTLFRDQWLQLLLLEPACHHLPEDIV